MKFLLPAFCAAMAFAGTDDTFLIRNVMVHPISGPSVDNVSLFVKDGKIAELGPKIAAPKGVRIIEGKGLHVYPGFINSGTALGMSEISSVTETRDTSEIGDFKPQLRTSIAVNPSSEHIPVIRANGITASMVLPEGGIIAGQASLMYLDGWTWEEMEAKRTGAMRLIFPTIGGGGGGRGFGGGIGRPSIFADSRRNYDRQVKLLETYFESARRYQKAKESKAQGFKTDLALEAMLPVLEGKVPVMLEAAKERTIRDALKWAEKETVKVVLSGVNEPGATLELIKKANVPVILGPTQELPNEEDDAYDSAFTLPLKIHQAGIKFAFASFENQFARNLPYQAATAVGFGLPREEALKSLTLYPAEIWGVDDRMGSVEKGKSADLMVTDGDPLEVKTQVKHLFIRGKAVDLESRHTNLYKKYLARP